MMKKVFTSLLLTSLFTTSLLVVPASAQDKRNMIGSYRDWDTYTITNNKGQKQCYMISTPMNSTPKGANRGSIYLTVTHVPHLKRMNEINTIVGYPLKSGSEVSVNVGRQRFKMFTSGDGAWMSTPKQDLDLVNVMKKGSNVIIRGTSSRGTNTADTYSLMGFTAAFNAITKACR